MIRVIRAALAFVVAGSASFAGSLAYVAPDAAMIEEPAMMGGSGAWLIPIVIIAVIALALSNSNGTPV